MKIKTLDKIVSPICPNILIAISAEENGFVKVCDGVNVFEIESTDCELVGNVGIKSKYDILKMYVVVDNSAPIGLGINGAVHAAYSAGSIAQRAKAHESIDYHEGDGDQSYLDDWLSNSYRNVTCTGSSEDIQTAISIAGESGIPYYAFNEPDWIDAAGRPLAVAFGPRYVWPDIFSKFDLHAGSSSRRTDNRTMR